MATLKELNDLVVGSPTLEQRFKAARIKAAWDVTNESVETEHHTERLVWATKIIDGYVTDQSKEYNRFLANATIQTSGNESADNDIVYVVNSLVNTYAGV